MVPGIIETPVSDKQRVVLPDAGDVVSNPVNDKGIKLKKDEGTWGPQLDDLATYRNRQSHSRRYIKMYHELT